VTLKSNYRLMTLFACLALISGETIASDRTYTNQVFFRGGYAMLKNDRGGEVFTDTGAASGTNDGSKGMALSAGIDLALTDANEIMGFGTLLGEVFMEYGRYSHNSVRQTTSALLAGTNNSEVSVSTMNATIAPKLRIDSLGVIRPFIIPAGMTWLVNSPPSNDATYLDFGIPFAAGIDLKFMDQLSVGMDFRYTLAFNHSNTENSYYSMGAYAGVNF
jgi:hypothetical protein